MLALLIAIVLTGPEPLKMPLSAIVDGRPVIVHLVSRDHVVSIPSSPNGPLYSAKTKDGAVLVSNATMEQLRESHPEIYEKVYPAITADVNMNDAIVGGYAGTD